MRISMEHAIRPKRKQGKGNHRVDELLSSASPSPARHAGHGLRDLLPMFLRHGSYRVRTQWQNDVGYVDERQRAVSARGPLQVRLLAHEFHFVLQQATDVVK